MTVRGLQRSLAATSPAPFLSHFCLHCLRLKLCFGGGWLFSSPAALLALLIFRGGNLLHLLLGCLWMPLCQIPCVGKYLYKILAAGKCRVNSRPRIVAFHFISSL